VIAALTREHTNFFPLLPHQLSEITVLLLLLLLLLLERNLIMERDSFYFNLSERCINCSLSEVGQSPFAEK